MTSWLGASPPSQRDGIEAALHDEPTITLALQAAGDDT
jgi:hypothetical protein